MSFIANVLVKCGLAERRKDGRIPARGLEVSYRAGSEQKRAKAKDISTTGIYIYTEERWPPGTAVELTLQRRSLLGGDARLKARLRTRCARLDDHGAGLTFVENPAYSDLWSNAMEKAAEIAAESEPVRLFRTARALAFLLRVCPPAENGVARRMVEGFSAERVDCAVQFVLAAEELLAPQSCATSPAIAPALLQRILEDGSKAAEEETQQLWAGLLAAACRDAAHAESASRFAALLSKLDSTHALMLGAACARAMRTGWKSGLVLRHNLHCTPDEIRRITRLRDLVAIERHLHHLHFLGLIGETARPLGCAPLEQINITPTPLGLRFYSYCQARTDLPEALECTELEMAS